MVSHEGARAPAGTKNSTADKNDQRDELNPTTNLIYPPSGSVDQPVEWQNTPNQEWTYAQPGIGNHVSGQGNTQNTGWAYPQPGVENTPSGWVYPQPGVEYPSSAWENSQYTGWTDGQPGFQYSSSGWDNAQSGYELQTIGGVAAEDPREGVPDWKWKGTIVLLFCIGIVYGYDVSNMANIQPAVYEAMGHIELLSCAVLAYAMATFAVALLTRKMTAIFNLRTIMAIAIVIFTVGAIISGAARSMDTIIVGRIFTSIGACAAYSLAMSYATLFGRPHEVPMIMGLLGMAYSIGIISGPVVGGAFAENHHATWRWAFYINAPYAGLLLLLVALFLPGYTAPSNIPKLTRLARVDWVGFVLHASTVVLFMLALTFGGISWDWDSGSTIAIWVIWSIAFVTYIIQQHLCLFTTPQDRLFPAYLFKDRVFSMVVLANSTGFIAHPVMLYYLPLYYAFARGHEALAAAVRLLPYICVCIAASLISGIALRKIGRYALFFLLSGVLFLVGGILMTRVNATTSESTVMGVSTLVGFGVGLTLPHGFTVANAILPTVDQRFDAAAVIVMVQLGATSTTLAVAGSIFQNVGFRLLKDAVRESGTTIVFTDEEIRGALSGVVSRLFQSGDVRLAELAIRALVDVIMRLSYLTVAGGVVCILATCFMGWQKLDFGVPEKETGLEARGE